MNKIINYIKKDQISFLKQLIIIAAAIGIAVSPFVVDYNTLPKGYELPKVLFYQIICAVIIALSTIIFLSNSYKAKQFVIPKSAYLVAVISVLFLLSALFATHQEIAIWGNSFRLQGLITYMLMMLGAYGVFKSINKINWHIIALSLIFSTVIQCGVAYNQFVELARVNPNAILEGIWVNGTFGQANWFAGRILIALIFSAFYFGLRLNRGRALRIIFKIYFGILILFFLIILGLTQSEWGMVSAAFAITIIFIYEIFSKKIFSVLLLLILALCIIGAGVFLKINTEYNLRIEILNSIITIITQPLSFNQIKILLLGFGFDTLGEVFKDYGLIKGLLVDRAHNFVLDIIIQNGFVVFIIFFGIIAKLFKKVLGKGTKNRIVEFSFIALVAWMFRSVIHENGMVNLMDFLFILAITAGLTLNLHHINSLNSKKA